MCKHAEIEMTSFGGHSYLVMKIYSKCQACLAVPTKKKF